MLLGFRLPVSGRVVGLVGFELAAYPSWMVGSRSPPWSSRLLWSILAVSSSRALQVSAQDSRRALSLAFRSSGFRDTLVRFHCLRPRLSVFCLPVSCSSALWRKPWANVPPSGRHDRPLAAHENHIEFVADASPRPGQGRPRSHDRTRFGR